MADQSERAIVFAAGDDGHLFGRETPVDGVADASTLSDGQSIKTALLDRGTADITLRFGPATRVGVFSNSMGYKGWQASYAIGYNRWSLIAMGDGSVAFISE